jgi:MFS family permease
VDRWDRKRVMVISDVVRGAMVLGFLFVGNADQMWLLYTIAFAQSTVATFFLPAKSAVIPAIVEDDDLLTANSVAEASQVIFMLLGTATAGVLAAVSETMSLVFWVDAATFAASAVLLSGIRAETRPSAEDAAGTVWSRVASGVRVILGSRVLSGVMVGGGVAMLGLGAVNVLLVPFIIDVLEINESWFGAIEGSQVVSMVVAGGLVAVLAKRFKPTAIISVGLGGVGFAVMAMSLATEAWHLMAVLFVVGWFITPLQASIATLVQSEVPDALRGRTRAALGTVATTANVVSMAAAGLSAAVLGVRGVFVAAGIVGVAAGIITAFLFRAAPLRAPEPENVVAELASV